MAVSLKLRRYLPRFAYLVFLLGLLELGARGFWSARGVPRFGSPREIHRTFYPELVPILNAAPKAKDRAVDILLLGGSALNNDYGNIEHVLREKLSTAGNQVRVYNAAMPGQTSLDSLYKYRHLHQLVFDLVIVYHGINEVRANNCPASVFRDDYGHYAWYNLINAYERSATTRWFALPYTLRFLVGKAGDRLGLSSYVPMHRPRPEAMAFGGEVKTGGPFRRNLASIVDLADARGARVVLMTFASYVAPNYTEARFKEHQLDYTAHLLPIELWGQPDHVRTALVAHNEAIRGIAREKPGALFCDLDALIPKERTFFNDVCHLTHQGCERFVDNLLPVLAEVGVAAGETGH